MTTVSSIEVQDYSILFEAIYGVPTPTDPVITLEVIENEDNSIYYTAATYVYTSLVSMALARVPSVLTNYSSGIGYAAFYGLDFIGRIIGESLERSGNEEAASFFPANDGLLASNINTEVEWEEDLGDFEWVEDAISILGTAALGTIDGVIQSMLTFNEFVQDPLGYFQEQFADDAEALYYAINGESTEGELPATKNIHLSGDEVTITNPITGLTYDNVYQFWANPQYFPGGTSGFHGPADSSDAFFNYAIVRAGDGDDFIQLAPAKDAFGFWLLKSEEYSTNGGEGNDIITQITSQDAHGSAGDDILIGTGKDSGLAGIAYGGFGDDIISNIQEAYGDQDNDYMVSIKFAYGEEGNDTIEDSHQAYWYDTAKMRH
jgi:hypothetical protein